MRVKVENRSVYRYPNPSSPLCSSPLHPPALVDPNSLTWGIPSLPFPHMPMPSLKYQKYLTRCQNIIANKELWEKLVRSHF